jgi:hypothetical protein
MECDKTSYRYPARNRHIVLTHRKHTQIRFSSRRCTYSLTCTHLATHGRDGQLQERCGLHAETDMINLLEKTCKSCDLVGLTDVNGLCETCDPKGSRGMLPSYSLPPTAVSMARTALRVNGGRWSMCQAATGLLFDLLTNTWSSSATNTTIGTEKRYVRRTG